MLIHISQVGDKEIISPKGLSIDGAARLAEALEMEAFLFTEDGEWYGFAGDEDEEGVADVEWYPLSVKLFLRLDRFTA
jgi:hypothetical protein